MEVPQQQGGAGAQADGGAPLSPPLSPASAAAAALANARWNPTKEQVAVLEGLYEHGLRTPSAEQIKQITARLRAHGQIEGKNVFYWFQNHKARQRQKQKQDSFAYFTRLLRRPPPLPMLVRPPGPPPYPPHGRLPVPSPVAPALSMAPPPPAAAACNNNNSSSSGGSHVMYRAPFYMAAPPQAPVPNAAYYHSLQQQHQQQLALMYPRMELAQDKNKMIPAAALQLLQQQHHHHPGGAMYNAAAASGRSAGTASPDVPHFPAADAGPSRQTLQLFPLKPTFLLPDNRASAGVGDAPSASASFSEESESLPESPDGEAPALPFYDFFSLQSGGR